MALLLNTQALAKSYGASFLFRNISLSVREGDRIGLIGPNGSGKSTLLEILAQRREPDTGEVALRKGTRLTYLPQDSQFPPGRDHPRGDSPFAEKCAHPGIGMAGA